MAKIKDFTPDPKNANRGTQRGLAALDTSLRKHGAGRSILVDKNNRVIAGNKTLERAADVGIDDVVIVESDGTKLVAVKRTDLDLETDPAARSLAYYDNRVGELDLEWEPLQIAADLEAGLDLDGLFNPDELAVMLEAAGSELLGKPKDAEPQIDKAKELQEKWGTATGQVWQLGRHRLIVGDCTDRAVVERLMEGERAAAVVTDPPYGVTPQNWDRLLSQADLNVMLENSIGAVIAFNAAKPEIVKNVINLTPTAKRIIIWRTNSPTIGGGMFWTWQPIYVWRTDLEGWDSYEWDASPTVTGGHPTQKPVNFVERLIKMVDGDIFDPFLGSGTTLIACENLNRQCRGIEIDPGYCAVTIQRWVDLTGQQPQRVSG